MTDEATAGGPILVVDDEPAIRDLLTLQLEFAGYAVLTAGDGEEGSRLLEENAAEIRLLVLDPKCPDTNNAAAVLETLRRVAPRLPVLLLSGDLREDAYAQVKLPKTGEAFASDFLQKPYRAPALEAKVAALLGA